MAWMTLEDLVAKGGVTTPSVGALGGFDFGGSNYGALTKNEKGALGELYMSAQKVMEQLGVPPDSYGSRLESLGDGAYDTVSVPIWTFDTINSALNSRNIKLAYDPSRDEGNWGSSRSHSIQLGVLDATGNPVQEYRVGEGSLASGFFKGFAVPFATLALTAGGTAASIGSSIVGSTAPAAVQKAVGSAVISGAGTALTGGDPEDVIRNALTAGAAAGASSLLAPYIQDAVDFVKDLTPADLEQVANSVDATAGATGDVANNLGQVEVGGATNTGMINLGVDPLYGGGYTTSNVAQAYNNLSPAAKDVFDIAVSEGADTTSALIRAAKEDARLAANVFAGSTETPTNALLGGGATAGAAGTAATTAPAGYRDPLAGGAGFDYAGVAEQSTARYLPTPQPDTMSTPTAITPTGQVATVDLTGGQSVYDPYTGLAENFPVTQPVTTPVIPETGAGLGTTAAGAGVLGAGALGAGAAGTVGGGLTVPSGAGLGEAGSITGGTGITAGTTGGTGLDTSGLALGGTLGAGLTGSALSGAGAATGALTAGGAAAAGLTGIQAVDDFLSYLGTPAGAMALSAFGGLAGGYFQGQAAKEAAQTQATAAQNALALQREMFEYQKGLLEPYQKAGTAALGRLTGVMGLGGQPATGGQQLLEMDPGYAFRLGEGMKALERLQAARGNMLSGGAIKAGQRYAQDVASQEYGNAFNRLARIAGIGQETGTQLGAAGQQFGQTASGAMGDVANAMAAGRIQRTGAYTGAISDVSKAYSDFYNQQQRNQLIRDIYGRVGG